MEVNEDSVKIIVNSIKHTFPTMGGGQPGDGNLVAEALKDKPLFFAMGVSVENVVKHILCLVN